MKMFFKNRDATRTYNKTSKTSKAIDGGAGCASGRRWFVEIKRSKTP